jgi:WD40 repeat protein
MRYLSALALFVGVAGLMAADDPKDKDKLKVPPIKVVTLDRKDPVVYEKDIEPILVAKCFFCHSGNVIQGKLDMSSYEKFMKGGKRGKPIIPGKSAESLVIKLAGWTERPIMPPRSETEEPLSPQELALLKLWIDQGAKPPTGASTVTRVVNLGTPPPNVQPVLAVAVSPDKGTIAAGRGNQIHIYDAKTGDQLRTLVNPNLKTFDGKAVQAAHLSLVESLTYTPDGKLLISGSFKEVSIWDPASGALKQRLEGFSDRVVALAVSKDGKLLATGGGAPTEDGEIKIYDLENGKLVIDIKNGHSDTVFGVSFSPPITPTVLGFPFGPPVVMLASCGADKFVKVFEVPSGKLVKSFEGHTHHVMDVGWKGDGKVLASGGADNVVKVWDFEKGEQLRTINNAHTKQVTRIIFVGATNQLLTVSGDQSLKMWNVDGGQSIRNFGTGGDYLYAVSVSPDGQLVAAGGQEGIVRVYNGADAKLLKSLTPPGTEAPKK